MGLMHLLKRKAAEVLSDPAKRAKLEQFAKDQARKRFGSRQK
jgi:hypothetical protein